MARGVAELSQRRRLVDDATKSPSSLLLHSFFPFQMAPKDEDGTKKSSHFRLLMSDKYLASPRILIHVAPSVPKWPPG